MPFDELCRYKPYIYTVGLSRVMNTGTPNHELRKSAIRKLSLPDCSLFTDMKSLDKPLIFVLFGYIDACH